MHFIYIDDSTERPLNIFSALCVPCDKWDEVFSVLKLWRKNLRDVHGIPLNFELHATEFLSGRGSSGRLSELSRHKRAQIFHSTVNITEWLFDQKGCSLFNVANYSDNQFEAFERLLNRINRTMTARNSRCHLICDQGKEAQYIKLVRKLKVHNPIPSRYGEWADGSTTRNMPLDRILEDPQFKDSKSSYFIQHVDFIAYSLLRREQPTPKTKRHGVHKTFEQLDNCLEKVCNRRDPKGIIR